MPFKIVRNDITKMKVDAVVNSANPHVAVGRGVDHHIYSAAGWDKLFEERVKIGPMRRGSAAITPAFDLDAKYIIHTVGPKWREEDPEPARRQLRSCYDNAMSLAIENGIKSIAFPLISTGNYGFPKEEGLNIAFTTISKYLYTTEMDVYLVIYDEEAFSLSKKLLDDIDEFIDSRYVEEAESTWDGDRAYMNYSPASFGNMAGSGPETPAMESVQRSAPPESLPKVSSKRRLSTGLFSRRRREERQTEEAEIIKANKVVPMEPVPEFPETEDFMAEADAYHGKEETPDESIAFDEYGSLEDLLKHYKGETFQERLFRFMDRTGKSDVEIYKGANLTKQTFSKIKKPGHIPKKRTVLALAISMGLSIDDTKDLLESAGQAFSPSDKIDLAVQYCMDHGIYSILEVERILFELFEETLVS